MKKLSLVVSTIILSLLFFRLLSNYSDRFEEVESNYQNKTAVNLVKGVDPKDISSVLLAHNYVANQDDAEFVSEFISQKINEGEVLTRIYDLTKDDWQIPNSFIDSVGSNSYVEKLSNYQEAANRLYRELDLSQLSSCVELDSLFSDEIKVVVSEVVKEGNYITRETRFCTDVIVSLSEHVYIDSLKDDEAQSRIIAYAKTNDRGVCVFKGLNPTHSYSVLPIKSGCNYGIAKGSVGGSLSESIADQRDFLDKLFRMNENTLVCSFNQKEQKIAIFDNSTIQKIKEDGSLTVRSPKEYRDVLAINLVIFLISWWGVFVSNIISKRKIDSILMAILMSLTGLCLLIMFSLNDPLMDRLLGGDMIGGIVVGVLLIAILQKVDFIRFFQGKSVVDYGFIAIVFVLLLLAIPMFFIESIAVKVSGAMMLLGLFLTACTQNKKYKKRIAGSVTTIDFDVPMVVWRWMQMPLKNKVCYLTQICGCEPAGNVLKTFALIAMLFVCILHILCVIAKWLCLPFKRKISKLVEKLYGSNTVVNIFCLLIIVLALPLWLIDILIWLFGIFRPLRYVKGVGYVWMALILTLLLFTPLGVAVGGMKVNLDLGFIFQPSEIAKYLVVLFMAAFFSINADQIIQFSKPGNTGLFGAKLRMLSVIIVSLGIVMFLYLFLGDMGPALVLAFTFIFLYSIIKSKVDLSDTTAANRLKRIFTCDIAMLFYGVVSFFMMLYVGNMFNFLWLGCLLWFLVWGLLCWNRNQIFETPVLFNLVVTAFIFGGSLLNNFSMFEDIAQRLEGRVEMCTNTWGVLPINGQMEDAGANTQVAQGLWGLASGGLFGQGLGNGSPHFIPAFQTDMILESIGEQMGFCCLLVIVILMAWLLRRTIVIGYGTYNPFAFYLCLGIAIVTAIQFVIIALGSTGIIPLTGVTVPFISYGKVSMILNLLAFGVVLSISSHNTSVKTQNEELHNIVRKNIQKYNYSISLLSWVYCVVVAILCSVFVYYQFLDRDDTLIRPLYVNNTVGDPIVEYNPRIAQLTNKMMIGDIYDRNGVLLATSNKSKIKKYHEIYSDLNLDCDTLQIQDRYYPFGEHMYFMLGDYNSKLFFTSTDRSPRGYMAEARHLTDLRGYDNMLRNEAGEPIKVNLSSDSYRPGRFYSSNFEIKRNHIQLRDYTDVIPYLKEGVNSDKVKRVNTRSQRFFEFGKIEPKDIQLTVDAVLQTKLQNMMVDYVNTHYRSAKWNKLRMSIVVLDAKNGDMLASANYPLPDYDVLIENGSVNYSDNNREESWSAYTERDLGLTKTSPPGSTAKVMSAIAGLRKLGVECANENNGKYYYNVKASHTVGLEPTGRVTMRKAIVKSSNCYFIHLINDHDVYRDLAYVYGTVGVELNGQTPYMFDYRDHSNLSRWNQTVSKESVGATNIYRRYRDDGSIGKMNRHPAWFWAWGQGTLWATPVTMARVASTVVNGGDMPVTRYVLSDKKKSVKVISSNEAEALDDFMREEAREKGFNNRNIGGKTGTAERILLKNNRVTKPNDGWFICYIDNAKVKKTVKGKHKEETSPLAIAVRLERLGSGMSGKAVDVTQEVVGVLTSLGYM